MVFNDLVDEYKANLYTGCYWAIGSNLLLLIAWTKILHSIFLAETPHEQLVSFFLFLCTSASSLMTGAVSLTYNTKVISGRLLFMKYLWKHLSLRHIIW